MPEAFTTIENIREQKEGEMRFKGKVAIVTASAGAGLGQTAARLLIQEGANVVVSDRSSKRLSEVSESIKALGGKFLSIECDVRNRQQVEEMVKRALGEWGTVDILINNAGAERFESLLEMGDEAWDLIVDTSLKGTFHCTRAVLPTMIKQKSGKIINISSIAAWAPPGINDSAAYSAAKGGVISFTRAVAANVAQHNINVNCIAPGFMYNPALEKIGGLDVEQVKESTPLKRLGQPMDIAKVALFLASEDASFLTGACISVSGGVVMY